MPTDPQRILDIGTGFGGNLLFLKQRFPNTSIWSLDPSEDTLRNAEELLREKGMSNKVRLVKGSAEKMLFDSNFFDLVVSVMVLHHMQDLAPALLEMHRVLAPNGKLLIADWRPEARALPFKDRPHTEDFIAPSIPRKTMEKVTPKVELFEASYWYLMEISKQPKTE